MPTDQDLETALDLDLDTVSDDPPCFGVADDGRLISAEEFADGFYEEPWKYERVKWRLLVMSPEGTGHVRQSEPWRDRLVMYKLPRPDLVAAVVSQAWVRIDDNDRIGDIGVYLGGTLDDLDIPTQAPDLMFEFVSKAKRDRYRDYVEKRAEYGRLGIPEYVIVDRFDRKVTALTLGEGGVYAERVLSAGEVYTSPLLPGFEVRLAEVLPR